MIKFDIKELEKELEEYKKKLDEGLREAVREYIQDFVYNLAIQNIEGDDSSELGKSWYEWRTSGNPSLYPLAQSGMSKSNWRITLTGNSTGFLKEYHGNEEAIGVKAYNDMRSYKLGQTVSIVNNSPYVYNIGSDTAGIGKYGLSNIAYQVDSGLAYSKTIGTFTKKLADLGITR